MSNFQTRINELKQINSITNRELADYVGITIRGLQFYLSGTKEPTMKNLIAIADFFRVSVDYLVGRTDNPNINV